MKPRSDDTKTNMAARLRALAAGIEEGPGVGPEMVKMIFDLKGAAGHLDDLDALLELIQQMDDELREDDAGATMEEMIKVAAEIRERKVKGSDPEPRFA